MKLQKIVQSLVGKIDLQYLQDRLLSAQDSVIEMFELAEVDFKILPSSELEDVHNFEIVMAPTAEYRNSERLLNTISIGIYKSTREGPNIKIELGATALGKDVPIVTFWEEHAFYPKYWASRFAHPTKSNRD